jgi:tetratricopeptide (TPR) repeat protein
MSGMQTKGNTVIAIIIVIAIAFSLFLIVPLGGTVGSLREATISFIFKKSPRFISLEADVEGIPQIVKAGGALKIKGGETIIITKINANTFFNSYLTADVVGFGKQSDLREPLDTAEIRDQLVKAGIRSVPIDIYYLDHKIAKVPLEINVGEQDFLDQLKTTRSNEEKISILRSAHAGFPKNTYFLNMLDNLLSAKGDYQGLVALYKGVADSEPTNMQAYANLSQYYIKLGQLDDALSMCQKIVDAGKADAAVYRRMAYIAGEKGDFDNRVAYLKKAIELDNKNEGAILDLAKTYEQAGMQQEALNVYNSAEDTANDKEILIPLIQESIKKQDYAKASELLKRYVRRYPQDKNAFAQLAMIMGKQGDSKSQVSYYQKALDLSPHDPVLLYNLGIAREKEGDRKGALDAYAKVLQIKPDDMDSQVRAAALSLKLNQFKEAYGYYRSLANKTKKKEYMKGLISAAVGLKDPDKIIDACEPYLKKNKDYEVAITLAYAHETRAAGRDASKKLADLDAALDAYKIARSINPESKVAGEKIPELKIETIRLRKNLQ